jgi:tetratricopeptide (TPR) repeat protein
LRVYQEALAFHEATGNWVQGSEVRLEVARCLAYLGREGEAGQEVAVVEAHLDELPPELVSLCRCVAGEVARPRGDHRAAVEHLSVTLEPTDEDKVFGWRVEFDTRPNLGQALQALGRNDEAAQAFASARELAVDDHQPFWVWEVNRCQRVSEHLTGLPSQVSELMSRLEASR